MAEERRISSRLPVDFAVLMRYRQRRFPLAQARELSAESMYVRTENITLPTGTLVEIELDRWGRHWVIPAVVSHGDKHGVGLMFRRLQPELFRLEEAWVTDQRPHVSAPTVFPAVTKHG